MSKKYGYSYQDADDDAVNEDQELESVAVPEEPADEPEPEVEEEVVIEPDVAVEAVSEAYPVPSNELLNRMANQYRKMRMMTTVAEARELLKNDEKLFKEVFESRDWH
jgi:hypothetical protein